jgi:[ribosomal protein S5]-alanine N-acetyltransferase
MTPRSGASAPPGPIPELAKLALVIETARLVVRPWSLEDVDAIWPIVSDPAFPRLMSWTAHTDRRETCEMIERATLGLATNEELRWAIEHGGRAIGSISLHEICWQQRALRLDRAELGYWLGPAHWGQGLMTEAVHAVIRFGFETMRLHKIAVQCMAENAASRRVIEKAGFRWVGRAEDDVWRDGVWHAHLLYELTAAEWPDVHTTLRMQRPSHE